MAGALKDQHGLDRQKWGLALQAERTRKARPVMEKPGSAGHHENFLVPEKSVGPGETARPALMVWI